MLETIGKMGENDLKNEFSQEKYRSVQAFIDPKYFQILKDLAE